ncbi:TRAP transporter small permease [Bacillus sp. 1P02SD]|uniref:TRAP transporter small permease n=1 Tax=Bacillus sp. 1P02SD TaxID=3132264 RepID=UPI0039A0F55F
MGIIRFIHLIDHAQQKIEKVLLFLGAVLTIFMMFLITLDVILRKLGHPIQGTFELVQVLTVGIVFLGAAYVQSIKGHVFIEVATDKLPKKIQQALDFFGYLIGIAVCVVITWQSGIGVWDSLVMNEVAAGIAKIPLWPAKIVIFIGMALLSIRLLLDIVYYLFPRLRDHQPITQMNTDEFKSNNQLEEGVKL